jgi:hypothetical protein
VSCLCRRLVMTPAKKPENASSVEQRSTSMSLNFLVLQFYQ